MGKAVMNEKYSAYPEYKDSGVEWAGLIPESWSVIRHKYIATFQKGKNPEILIDEFEEGAKRYLSMDYLRGNAASLYAYPVKNSYVSKKNQVLIIWDGSNAGEFVIAQEGIVSSTMAASEFLANINQRYYWYLCICLEPEMRKYANGMGIPHVDGNELKNSFLTIPSDSEAEKIANFLDHETAKIDTLIENQQQLIALLKEKRQAVISHAVTKGLNPNAPMKNSGVEWLGDVPEHWEMVPLKYLCNFSGGGTPSKDNLSYWTGGDIPWVSPKDMKSFWVSDTQDKLTEIAVKESSTNFVEAGALLMVVRSGILQRTIPIAINTVQVTLNQDMKALKFNERLDVEYAANYILGNVSSLLLEWSKEGATVESIEQEFLSASLFPVPPIDEQISINEKIKERMDVFGRLELRALKGINLLKERRTALISAAVTGKIDVRNWVLPEEAKNMDVA
jgi:type I restriction enzyme S subunit